eukprot:1091754-Pyramimonas_sp.AAC.1
MAKLRQPRCRATPTAANSSSLAMGARVDPRASLRKPRSPAAVLSSAAAAVEPRPGLKCCSAAKALPPLWWLWPSQNRKS